MYSPNIFSLQLYLDIVEHLIAMSVNLVRKSDWFEWIKCNFIGYLALAALLDSCEFTSENSKLSYKKLREFSWLPNNTKKEYFYTAHQYLKKARLQMGLNIFILSIRSRIHHALIHMPRKSTAVACIGQPHSLLTNFPIEIWFK